MLVCRKPFATVPIPRNVFAQRFQLRLSTPVKIVKARCYPALRNSISAMPREHVEMLLLGVG